jgi:glycine/D-amino acid oxidase-like deaminating enzyme
MPKPRPKHGELRVWWIPQVPMKAFHYPVGSIIEARLLLDALAQYDLFQLQNRIKPDYCNTGGLQVFDVLDEHDGPRGSWVEWHDKDGEDIDFYTLEQLRTLKETDELPVCGAIIFPEASA